MNKFDRIQQLHAILTNRRTPISLQDFMEKMECREATVKRLIAKFRHEFGAPIIYDRTHNGYCMGNGQDAKYELPGLWFTLSELHALLTIQELLDNLQTGLLKEGLAPFRQRIEEILSANDTAENNLCQRIRIINVAGRMMAPEHFAESAAATIQRKRLRIHYRSRSQNRLSHRIVSPQRLIYYRENWYLDVWCHTKEAMRTFSLDRIETIKPVDQKAKDISDEQLNGYFTPTYGLFGGEISSIAVLKFSADRARWVADERWHSDQQKEWCVDGSFILRLPYADHRELILDILRFGPDVEVLEPPELRKEVKHRLRLALEKYKNKKDLTGSVFNTPPV